MDATLNNFGGTLSGFIERNLPIEADKFISLTIKHLETELPSHLRDAYLLIIFNSSNGILCFLDKVLHNSDYKKAKLKSFDLLYLIIKNNSSLNQDYLINTIEKVSLVVRSSASAIEKQKSLKLITLIILTENFKASFGTSHQVVTNLYQTFYQCLHRRFDSSNIVQEELIKAVGAISKKFPMVIDNYIALQNLILNDLSLELNKDKSTRSLAVICGCIEALSNTLENFDNVKLDAIYKILKILVIPGDSSRRVAHRAALSLTTKHMGLFSKSICAEAEWWHKAILDWLSLGADDVKAATSLLKVFYIAIMEQLIAADDDYDYNRKLVMYFLSYFESELTKKNVHLDKKQLVIFGLGQLSQTFNKYLCPTEIDRVFVNIAYIIEHTYVLNFDENLDQMSFLPHYMETLSLIIKNQQDLNMNNVLLLEKVCVILIKIFPRLSPSQHYLVVESFMMMAIQCSNVLEYFLENVLYQGVMWTCSHRIALEAEINKAFGEEIYTYKKYMPFWIGILSTDPYKFSKYDIKKSVVEKVVNILFLKLLETHFTLIRKLNLNTKLKDNNTAITNLEVSYVAIQANDFVIFVNIVDFYEEIFEIINIELFRSSLLEYINKILLKAIENPLVSGFYKLLACSLKFCDKLNIFENRKHLSGDLATCHSSISKLMQDILWKIKLYRGDLQIACIKVVLACPISIVKMILPSTVPLFISLFDIGRSYLKLASVGVDTLSLWFAKIPRDDFEPFLKHILPCLDSYLQSKLLNESDVRLPPLSVRKTAKAITKRKMLVETESELFQVQVKILKFVGQLNGNLCAELVNSTNPIEHVTNSSANLTLALPFEGAEVKLGLDRIAFRIVQLAVNSSNRKIRVAACEVLHAMVMMLLGTSHPLDGEKLKELGDLVKLIVKPVFKLGCDVDQAIQQLFCPLALQLMHYYSHPRQIQNSHTEIIVELLIEAVSDPTDASLRDFAGKCIREYVTWTIKQITSLDLLKNPINIKVWIRVIKSFCVHPDLFKRLGAAIIFNNIYDVLKGERLMFNMFWLEVLSSFVLNLSLMDESDNDNLCGELVYKSLELIQKGFIEKHSMFNDPSTKRRTPYGFNGNLLKDVVLWVFRKTGCINSYCRLKCMNIVVNLAPLVQNCDSLQIFVSAYLSNNDEWILSTYETELSGSTDFADFSILLKWLQGILCALDGYVFAISNNLISNPATFSNSKLVDSLQFFFTAIFPRDANDIFSLISRKENNVLTIIEIKQFEKWRNFITDKVITLLTTILNGKSNITSTLRCGASNFWNLNLWNFLGHAVFDLDSSNHESYDKLLSLLNRVYTLPENSINELTHVLSSYIIGQLLTTSMQNSTALPEQSKLLNGMLILQQSSLNEKLNISKHAVGIVNYLYIDFIKFVNDEERRTVEIPEDVINVFNFKLDIALANEQEFLEMCKFLSDSKSFICDAKTQREIQYNVYFFDTYKETLLKHLLKNYKLFTYQVFRTKETKTLFRYLIEILKYVEKRRNQFNILELITITLDHLENSLEYFNQSYDHYLQGLDLINKLIELNRAPLYNLTGVKPNIIRWIIALLTYTEPQWTHEFRFNFISQVLVTLPSILEPLDKYTEQLRSGFLDLKNRYFNETNANKILQKTTLIKFLNAMKVSKSSDMLLWTIKILMDIPDLVKSDQLQDLFKQLIRISPDQNKTLSLTFQACFDFNLTYKQRYFIANSVLATMLQHCDDNQFEDFFVTTIKQILDTLSPTKASMGFDKREIVNRTIALVMIEVLFPRLKLERLDENSCKISKAGFPDKLPSERDLIKTSTRYILEISKEEYNLTDGEEKEIFRLYQCHSYNTLASIITSTQKDVKFYNWLFSREKNKENILWKNLIDLDKKFVFESDFDTVPVIKKKLMNIRNNLKNAEPTGDNLSKAKYLESQHLFNSTLSEDVTQFDFSGTVLRSQSDEGVQNKAPVKNIEIALEVTPVNEHECMGTICALIQFMVDNGISGFPETTDNVLLPMWMKEIRNTLMSNSTHTNVKVFLMKIIHNTQHVFKYYAKWFLGPIINAIVSSCFGDNINYFVADLVTMLCSWFEFTASCDEINLTSDLLKFCMINVNSTNRAIFKYNLELVKLILETWRSHVIIPHQILYAELLDQTTSHKLEIGIHLAAIVLANNMAPWKSDNIPKFLKTLTKILTNNYQNIYRPCSEVLGMSLQYMSNDSTLQIHLQKFVEIIHKSLALINDDNKFAYCLHGMAIHYPSIADRYLSKMISKLIYMVGNFKSIYLKIFLLRIDALQSLNELSSIDFANLISYDNMDVQLVTLELIQKAVNHFESKNLFPILNKVLMLTNSPNVVCRTVVFDIFIDVYEMYHRMVNSESVEIIKVCNTALLQGLIDKDLVLQEKIVNFWSINVDMPKDISKRILYLLQNMYHEDVEEHYIGYSTYLILNLLTHSPEFTKNMFAFNLHDCQFQEYRLNSNWRMQHISTAPLFVESVRTQETNLSLIDFNILRATLTSGTFETTLLDDNPTTSQTSLSQLSTQTSSLLINLDPTPSSAMDQGVFKNPNDVLPKISIVRGRRFLKDRSKISRHYAYLETTKMLKAEEFRKEKVTQNERKVSICRKYRIGDYPDIEITLASIMSPLQILAKNDASLSRSLYTHIFVSVFNDLYIDGQLDGIFLQDINSSINYIFKNSVEMIPSLIGTFLDVTLKFPNALQFDPDLITHVCELSGLYSVGSLVLEEYLICKPVTETPAKKSKGVVTSDEHLYWINYARLYKDMEEWDVVGTVFMEKLNCSEQALSGLEAECNAQWRSAQEYYAQAFEDDVSENQKDFYYESYFKCLASLGEWSELTNNIQQLVGPNNQSSVWSTLWTEDWNKQKLLPWYIKGELRKMFRGRSSDLLVAINALLSDAEKQEYLKFNYSEEIAMMWLLQNDNSAAKVYLNAGITQFLENWLHVNPLLAKLRLNKIIALQTLIDIYMFISEYDKLNAGNCKTQLDVISKYWEHNSQDGIEPLMLSETKTMYRNQFLSKLTLKLQMVLHGHDGQEIEEVSNTVTKLKFKMHLNLVEKALDCGNYALARKYIKLSPKPDESNAFENMRWFLSLSKILYVRGQTSDDKQVKLSECINSLLTIDITDFIPQDDFMCYFIKANLHICNISEDIYKIAVQNNDLFVENKAELQQSMNCLPLSDPKDICTFKITSLKNSLEMCENAVENMMNNEDLKVFDFMATAYVKLAYCVQDNDELEDTLISSILRSMKLGSVEGRYLFPCLLNKNIGTEFKEVFTQEIAEIPTWMFLGWIPQMLSHVDTSNFYVISNILLKISKMYPQAIMYAYRLGKNKYSATANSLGDAGKEILEQMETLLINDTFDVFLKAISYVSVPAQILKENVKKLIKACNASDKGTFDTILKHIFENIYYGRSDYKDVHSFQGLMYESIKTYEDKLKKISKGKFETTVYKEALNKIIENLTLLIKDDKRISFKLAEYSPWLANYQVRESQFNIEIPGQYTGEKMPIVQHHVKIMGFSSVVQVMKKSIRQPIKITIFGNNAKDYHYLVKYGEDLRQDQRIQQVFTLMNTILLHDLQCVKRQLSICTYQVVPLTEDIGIIQWINNVKELKTLLEDNFGRAEIENTKTAFLEFNKWIQTPCPGNFKDDVRMIYGYASLKYDRMSVICKYKSLVNSVPLGFLKKCFWSITANSESFFAIRHKFAVSYAVMCIANWLLGIGDRHLSNILVSLQNGEAIGVDFGHAFGTATEILPVPELVPFRLTPHILGVLEPLNELGLIQETMVHSLKAFRSNFNVLMETMNVFIKEPSLDWLETAKRSEMIAAVQSNANQEWYPARKLRDARLKLQGENSANIIIEELKAGHGQRPEFLKAYIELVKGLPEFNYRAVARNNLSEEEQVKCLIDHATDPNLLGRMYAGWMGWM